MKPEQRPPTKRRLGTLALYYIFWAAILILLGALFVNQMESYNERRAELTRINTEVEREQAEYVRLTYQLESLDREDYIERLARDILGMVRPNEIVFRNMAE
ncbi:MAG: septum formation initiator family protein [Defluviitaleaceae bacterium]|nr:septum formation initiator family protein [Defluviitaleaceae bacterium]